MPKTNTSNRGPFDLILIEKLEQDALSPDEIRTMLRMMAPNEAYEPILYESDTVPSVAMGFLRETVADELNYDTRALKKHVVHVMDDMGNANDTGIYEFNCTSNDRTVPVRTWFHTKLPDLGPEPVRWIRNRNPEERGRYEVVYHSWMDTDDPEFKDYDKTEIRIMHFFPETGWKFPHRIPQEIEDACNGEILGWRPLGEPIPAPHQKFSKRNLGEKIAKQGRP